MHCESDEFFKNTTHVVSSTDPHPLVIPRYPQALGTLTFRKFYIPSILLFCKLYRTAIFHKPCCVESCVLQLKFIEPTLCPKHDVSLPLVSREWRSGSLWSSYMTRQNGSVCFVFCIPSFPMYPYITLNA